MVNLFQSFCLFYASLPIFHQHIHIKGQYQVVGGGVLGGGGVDNRGRGGGGVMLCQEQGSMCWGEATSDSRRAGVGGRL